MAKSGIQRDVLKLYRSFLRAARSKAPETRGQVETVVKTRFRQDAAAVKRTDFRAIEFRLRNGRKQLKLLENPNVKNLDAWLVA